MSFKAIGDNGRELRLSFLHGKRKVAEGKNKGKEKRFIEAHILLRLPGEDALTKAPSLALLGMGVASCSFEDQFSNEEGRAIALERAIEDAKRCLKISRPEAGEIMKVYFTRKEKKRPIGTLSDGNSGEGGGMTHRERRALKATLSQEEKGTSTSVPVEVPPGLTLPPVGWQPKEGRV